jgi:RNA polymerase sigma-70 factor (ECF subfamily)
MLSEERSGLVERARRGDRAAFRGLYEAHAATARRVARALLADPAAAEDAAQDAWVDAWRGLPRFLPGRPFRPWLVALVANRCRMTARRRAVDRLDPGAAERLADRADVAAQATAGLVDPLLVAALAALPPAQRRVLELRVLADLDLAEIAAATGRPVGTVKSRLHRAVAALRIALADPSPDGPKLNLEEISWRVRA